MTAAPELDAARGRLLVGEDALTTLVAHTADPVATALESGVTREELVRLHEAGVIEGGRAHPSIAAALAAIVRPQLLTLELAQGGRSMRGWVSYDAAALLLPQRDEADGRQVLLQIHPTLLPDALARLVDLGPRPPAGGDVVPYEQAAAAGVRRRWLLVASWELAGGRRGGDGLEVLDAESGLWLLAEGEEGTLAWPVTATFVWRRIVRLVMRRAAA